MRKYIILTILVFVSAFAKAYSEPITQNNKTETPAVDWTGTYRTNHGDIILHQKGNYVVGTYGKVGAIRSTQNSGNVIRGIFYNNGNEGEFQFTKTSQGFNGAWRWKGSSSQGKWNGTKIADMKQHYLEGDWKTNFQNIYFVHSPTGIVAGHYGNNGGMIWGKYDVTYSKLTGNYTTKEGAKVEDFSMNFISNNEFKGRYNNTNTGSWNGTRVLNTSSTGNAVASGTKKAFLLKNTLNSIKFNRSNDIGDGDMQEVGISSTMTINNRAVPSKDASEKRTSVIYDGAKRKWSVGEVERPQTSIVFHIAQSLQNIDHNASFTNTFNVQDYGKVRFGVWGIPNNEYAERKINLKEILKFLSGTTQANDYPIVPNTSNRRRIPNTDDTFWLETVGGNRYARGYGDILLDSGDLRYGYHYTLELVKE
ncbi:hypothetical protein EAX61_10385 [Dokdonia sinensis]|uniref:Uncharacterized protein n=1 Tax=Dokdonia sinensis TaxID=2479847 RepID=A0A3M0G1K8_9FLAO|nr:hypothetical protein [Dokdonia sinensis]RMB58017.1 hypothetical protein EAX61_10385 [Dokdonia sinensis]